MAVRPSQLVTPSFFYRLFSVSVAVVAVVAVVVAVVAVTLFAGESWFAPNIHTRAPQD